MSINLSIKAPIITQNNAHDSRTTTTQKSTSSVSIDLRDADLTINKIMSHFKAKQLIKRDGEIVCLFLNKSGDKFNIKCIPTQEIKTDIEFLKAVLVTESKLHELYQNIKDFSSCQKLISEENRALIRPQIKNLNATTQKIATCDKKDVLTIYKVFQRQVELHEAFLATQKHVYPKQIKLFQDTIDLANTYRQRFGMNIPYVGRHQIGNAPYFYDTLTHLGAFFDTHSLMVTSNTISNPKVRAEFLETNKEAFFKLLILGLNKCSRNECTLEDIKDFVQECPFHEINGQEIINWGGTTAHICSLIELLPTVHTIDISQTDVDLAGVTFPPELKVFLCSKNSKITSSTIKNVAESCLQLEVLDVSMTHADLAGVVLPPSVTKLNCSNNNYMSNDTFNKLIANCTNLLSLDIGATKISLQGASIANTLQALHCWNNLAITNDLFRETLSNLPLLKDVNIGATLITLEGCILPATLEFFSCTGSKVITDDHFINAMRECSNITHVNLSSSRLSLFNYQFPETLKVFVYRQSIIEAIYKQIPLLLNSVSAALKNCSKLEVLDVWHTPMTLKEVPLSNIKILILPSLLTNETLQESMRVCSKLEILCSPLLDYEQLTYKGVELPKSLKTFINMNINLDFNCINNCQLKTTYFPFDLLHPFASIQYKTRMKLLYPSIQSIDEDCNRFSIKTIENYELKTRYL